MPVYILRQNGEYITTTRPPRTCSGERNRRAGWIGKTNSLIRTARDLREAEAWIARQERVYH